MPLDLQIGWISLTKNAKTTNLSVVVYLKGSVRCPFSTINGLTIIWKSTSTVNYEGKVVAEKISVDVNSITQDLPQVSGDVADLLFCKHSNLTMISPSPFKSKNFKGDHEITKQPCIVLYCRSKGEIPIGEDEFPLTINQYKTDVREGICTFGSKRKLSIGNSLYVQRIPCYGKLSQGSLGGFIKTSQEKLNILTCAHLFFSPTDLHSGRLNVKDKFVQPDDKKETPVCARMSDVKFNFGSPRVTSIDAALLHIDVPDNYEISRILHDFTQLDIDPTGTSHKTLSFEKGEVLDSISNTHMLNRVIKQGSESGLTCGILACENSHVRIGSHEIDVCESCRCIRSTSHCPHTKFRFYHQYEVYSSTQDPFFIQGDSGSLVFMLKNLKSNELQCIGMAIASTSNGSGIVTPIRDILQALKLEKDCMRFSNSTGDLLPEASRDSSEGTKTEDNISKMLGDFLSNIDNKIESKFTAMHTKIDDLGKNTSDLKVSVESLKADNEIIRTSVKELQDHVKEQNDRKLEPSSKKRKFDDS